MKIPGKLHKHWHGSASNKAGIFTEYGESFEDAAWLDSSNTHKSTMDCA